jgi:hypothetical protein
MNAYRKQECPRDAHWNTFQNVLVKNVLDRELPIVQAIVVDTRRDSNSKRNVKFKSFY